jgi:hypothetical protein
MQPVVPDVIRLFSQSPQKLGTFYSRQHDIYNGSSFSKVCFIQNAWDVFSNYHAKQQSKGGKSIHTKRYSYSLAILVEML